MSAAILIGLFHLWHVNLHESFFYGEDGLLSLIWTKNTVESGWYLDSDRLATPGTMDNRAFPISESLHFAVMKGIALFDRDASFVLNVYMLLTFPLSALTSLFVFRHFGCSRSTALLGSQLFAFLPYQLMRVWLAGHLFLGAAYLLPLASLVLIWVYLDDGVFFHRTPEGRTTLRLLSGRSLGALVISLLMASAGIYYAFFYCFFLIVSALAGRRGTPPPGFALQRNDSSGRDGPRRLGQPDADSPSIGGAAQASRIAPPQTGGSGILRPAHHPARPSDPIQSLRFSEQDQRALLRIGSVDQRK